MVSFTVPGKPMTWARARIQNGPGLRFITPADRRLRMNEIRDAWQACGVEAFERGSFLRLSCLFVFERPASHFGTGRNAGILKESKRVLRPTTGVNGGDLDNLVKLIKDALNHVAFHDDSQIVEYGDVRKDFCGYDEMARTEVTIERVKHRVPVVPEQPSLLVAA